eukprot:766055-Hanusia_phi.AAC.12
MGGRGRGGGGGGGGGGGVLTQSLDQVDRAHGAFSRPPEDDTLHSVATDARKSSPVFKKKSCQHGSSDACTGRNPVTGPLGRSVPSARRVPAVFRHLPPPEFSLRL